MENLLNNSNSAKIMGEHARLLVNDRFDLDTVAGQMIDLYRDIIR